MAELQFDREPDGTPYDRKQELTEWLVVDTVPAAADGERFPARAFSAGGYRATDSASLFLGLQGVAVHAIIAPDFAALVGAGRVALAYRGHGGPVASAYWAWGVELERVADDIEVWSVHQDQGGVFVEQLVGTFPAVGEWLALAVSREVTPDGFESRAWLNGAALGKAVLVTSTTATPGEPVTLGCRIDAFETSERVFLGRIERALISDHATTDAEVQHQYSAMVGAYPDAYQTWAQYLPSALVTTPESGYGRWHVRPMAELVAQFDAAAQRHEAAALPPTAYGPQLAALETALGLSPMSTDTIASRQAAAHAALAGTSELSPESLQALAALLFGVVPGDVEILEGRNYLDHPVVGAGELTGPPWRVRGPVDVTNEVGGLTIHVPAGRDIRYRPLDDRGVFVELGIHHMLLREADHGLALTIDSAAGLSLDTWCGISLAAPDGAVWWLALDSGGVVLRSFNALTGLSARAVLDGAAVAPLELVAEWTGAEWEGRWRTPGTGPGGWTSAPLPAPTTTITWFGASLGSALSALALDIDVLISAVTSKAGDSPSWAYWQAFDLDPVNRDIVAHSVALDKVGRAVSYGSATYQPELFADTDGAAWDYTPTILFGPRLAHIGDTAADAAQSTGIYPGHLWTMQELAAPVVDSIGGVALAEVAPAPTYQAAGPVDRFAVEFAGNTNALQAGLATDLDTAGGTVLFAMILRITGDGLILGKEQTPIIGWFLSKTPGNIVLQARAGGVPIATATLADGASGFVVDQWFALAGTISASGTVSVATSQGSATGIALLAPTNTGLFALGAGISGVSAIHRTRWLMATVGGEATAANPAVIAARLAAAAGVA